MAEMAFEAAEDSRRQALYQSYASFGSEVPPEAYGAEEVGQKYYQQQQRSPQQPPSPPSPQQAPPLYEQAPPRQEQPPPPARAGPDASSPVDRVPPGRMHQQQRSRMSSSPRMPSSPGGGFSGGSGSDSERRRSGFSPNLFEKGSFQQRKIHDVQRASSGDTPLSGRSTNRSGGASMGAYADFASRMHGAESNRSSRSARSYRG